MRIQFLGRDKKPAGTVKELDVTSMDGAQWNLLGVMYLVIQLGFTFMIKPDRSVGLVKFDANTGLPVEELPAYIDDDTGLIIVEFVIAGTRAARIAGAGNSRAIAASEGARGRRGSGWWQGAP